MKRDSKGRFIKRTTSPLGDDTLVVRRTTLMYEIESNVAIPTPGNKGTNLYPVEQMKTGDSFFVPTEDNSDAKKKVQGSISAFARRKGVKMALRAVEGGVRAWRIS